MRISTAMIYDLGVSSLQQRQQDQVRLQQQISSGKRILTPSDDPIAAAAALNVKQSQALNLQYKTNGDTAKSQLSLEESALSDVTTLLQNVRTLAVNAGDPTLTNADRTSIATELDSNYQQLLGIANRGDGNGQFLFSGYQGATQPFGETSPGVVAYSGDAGQRLAQIGPARTIPVNDSGDAVFRAIHNGNGTFAAAAAGANSGTGIIDSTALSDPSKWNTAANAKDFTIRFSTSGGVTTYDIVDNVNNVSMLTGAAPAAGPYLRTYTPGTAINLATQSPPDTNPAPFDFGATVTISGAPANGDSVSVHSSTNQDMFSTLHNLITALRTGTNANPASNAQYQNTVNSSLNELDNGLNNVLKTRASVGARLKEVDTAQSSADDIDQQYTQTLSGLQDLDYTKAISDLNQQQIYLQAAQQSFLKITKLNLFDLL
jgi:flagellar hook-associated protein 3 FlgL